MPDLSPIKCLIIEDEPPSRKILKEYIRRLEDLLLIGEANNPMEAKELFNLNSIELIFCDIKMPKMNGLEFLADLKRNNLACIIASAHPEYALQGYDLNAIDYLLKPYSFERFETACQKAKHFLNKGFSKNTDSYFFIKTSGKIEKIEYSDLLYIESLGNYLILHLSDRKVTAYYTLKGLLEQLPEEKFIRIHKSFIVNKEKISSIEESSIQIGNARIPISQIQKEEIMNKILNNRFIKR